jgi:hypothetical protein
MTADCILLIHKYEAYGIADHVRQILQEEPNVSAVVAMVEFFPEHTAWLTSTVLNAVLEHYCASDICSDTAFYALTELPAVLLSRLVVFCAYAGRRNMVEKINVFRPALDDRLFHV